MDRLIYTAMTGAKHILEQQASNSHNLANATFFGFCVLLDSFRAVPVQGEGFLPTRAFVVDSTVGVDFTPASIQQTGRELDVAVQGKGWIAVEAADGSEAYTRDGGPISIPPDVKVAIAKDGTVSAVGNDPKNKASTVLGRIKLVNPPEEAIVRGDDGLFRQKDGNPADADANVVAIGGALEGSNVNVVDAMVNMISLARQFEMHMNLLKNAESNSTKASQLLALS